jgi:transposase
MGVPVPGVPVPANLQLRAAREAAGKWKREIIQLANQLPAYHDLQVVPGFGPVNTSAYLAAIGDGSQFKCGRQVSAWLGLTPGQYGTGGNLTLLGITKQGDRYARKMLIHGARGNLPTPLELPAIGDPTRSGHRAARL